MFKISKLAAALIFTSMSGVSTVSANDDLINWFMKDDLELLEANLSQLEPQLVASQINTTNLTADLNENQSLLLQTTSNITSTEQTIADLENQITTLQNSQESTDLSNDIDQLQSQLLLAQEDLASLQTDANDLQTSIISINSDLQDALGLQTVINGQIEQSNGNFNTELDAVTAQVGALSQKQIKSLLHTMHTTASNGIEVQLDSTELGTILDNDYSFQQTNLYLKAQTEEAKFLSKAEALRAEAAATGDTSLLEEAEKMEDIAAKKAVRFENLASGHPAKSEHQNAQGSQQSTQGSSDKKPANAGNSRKGKGSANNGKRK